MAGGASAADVRSILSFAGAGPSASSNANTTARAANTQPTASSSKTPQQYRALTATASLQNAASTPHTSTTTRKGKPEGITRELYALIGSGLPTLNAQMAAKPKFKQKPNLSNGKVGKWEWRSFENKARSDGLKLSHWVKASSEPDVVYPFSKYNVPAQTYEYTDEEYTKLLEDPDWTKEETDYLFSLVHEYDVRFYVVADRYDYKAPHAVAELNLERAQHQERNGPMVVPVQESSQEKMDVDAVEIVNGVNGHHEGTQEKGKDVSKDDSKGGEEQKDSSELKCRTIEDIKDRYYTVCRRLIRSRPWTEDESARSQLLASYQYDKDCETTRKKYIASLENRTPEQIAEEDALYVEIKRLEQDERRFARSREELLRVFAGIESGLASVALDDEAGAALFGDAKKNKKKGAIGGGGMDIDSPISAQGVISLGPPQSPTKKTSTPVYDAAYDALHCIHRYDASTSTTKSAHVAAHIRTWKIAQPKSAIAPRILQTLAEVGVSGSKLVMPTRENVQLLDSLMQATTALVETKRQVDRLDQEIKVAKELLGMVEEEEAASASAVWERGKGKGPVPKPVLKVEDVASALGQEREEEEGDGDGYGDAEGELEEDTNAEVQEAGRAMSVATSTRSMSRKRNKRSVSISSVDTSTTNATRAPRKRQKNQ